MALLFSSDKENGRRNVDKKAKQQISVLVFRDSVNSILSRFPLWKFMRKLCIFFHAAKVFAFIFMRLVCYVYSNENWSCVKTLVLLYAVLVLCIFKWRHPGRSSNDNCEHVSRIVSGKFADLLAYCYINILYCVHLYIHILSIVDSIN